MCYFWGVTYLPLLELEWCLDDELLCLSLSLSLSVDDLSLSWRWLLLDEWCLSLQFPPKMVIFRFSLRIKSTKCQISLKNEQKTLTCYYWNASGCSSNSYVLGLYRDVCPCLMEIFGIFSWIECVIDGFRKTKFTTHFPLLLLEWCFEVDDELLCLSLSFSDVEDLCLSDDDFSLSWRWLLLLDKWCLSLIPRNTPIKFHSTQKMSMFSISPSSYTNK